MLPQPGRQCAPQLVPQHAHHPHVRRALAARRRPRAAAALARPRGAPHPAVDSAAWGRGAVPVVPLAVPLAVRVAMRLQQGGGGGGEALQRTEQRVRVEEGAEAQGHAWLLWRGRGRGLEVGVIAVGRVGGG